MAADLGQAVDALVDDLADLEIDEELLNRASDSDGDSEEAEAVQAAAMQAALPGLQGPFRQEVRPCHAPCWEPRHLLDPRATLWQADELPPGVLEQVALRVRCVPLSTRPASQTWTEPGPRTRRPRRCWNAPVGGHGCR